MSHPRTKLLAAFALVTIAVSIFGRGVTSRGFASLGNAAGGPSSGGVRRANGLFQTLDEPKSKQRGQFTIYRSAEGEIVCRQATAAEIRERERIDPNGQGLRQINHYELTGNAAAQQSLNGTGLTIILRATPQLQQNPAATAAFTRAAQNWEAIIMSPVTIYIDVDYGTTNFGQTWPDGVLGATAVPIRGYPHPSVRTSLIAEANGEGNATKQAIFNALPSNTIPTDLGDGSGTDVADANGRAIGLLSAVAQSTDDAARIGFNSNFSFDFDPSDGITAGQTDFDAVATHEIGHALGFDSDAGENLPRPAVWDLYRFRTGTTSGTFTNAQRIVTIGGSPDPLQFFFTPGNSELGLATGGPAGSTSNGGDGWQSSHWKHVNGCVTPIGVMDPAIPSGCRRTISANDQLALSSFGYNLTNNNAPPPPPPPPSPPANDNFANAQTISGCSGSTTGVSFGATSEAGEPSHDPTDSTSLSPSHTVWYQWQAPSFGSNTITTAGSDFDTILAVYTGSSVGSLTRLVFNDDVQDGVIRTSTVTFNATAGTTYRIAVDGWGGDMGAVKLNWNGCIVPTPTPTPTPIPTPTATPTPTPTPTPSPTPLCLGDGWTATSLTNAPVARNSHSAIWTGSEMIVWGGFDSGNNWLNTGSKYNPSTDTWSDITTTNAPAARALHSAVWTGTEMIVWGGSNSTGFLNSGARYNPATNTWTAISTVNAPSPRIYQTAAWTGTEMVVWGGLTSNYVNTGARYNPATDTWTATSLANAPSSRGHHSAVWTGSEMIVWGGNGILTPLENTGGRYNPITDGWISTTTTNAPAGRVDHTAVWTGTEMLVWGGGSPGVRTNTGARYTPGTNSWVAMNTSNAPAARGQHGAVWTGFEMVVWGGTDNTNLLNSGGSYKPTSDSWTASCETNVPTPRGSFSTIWSGKQMIVWGGINTVRLSTGGRYSVPHPIDDPTFFVKQHYLDFLNRTADQSGLDFWTGTITSCGSDPQCIEVKRINTSAAFFLSIEFQQTGNLVYKMYKAGFGNLSGKPVAVDRAPFLTDTRQIQSTPAQVIVGQPGWDPQLESNKQAFALAFVQRSAFQTAHAAQSADQYVSSLFANTGAAPTAAETSAAISAFNAAGGGDAGRAAALRSVAESGSVHSKLVNEAFVLMQYFGYLQRNPYDPPEPTLDYAGYNFWLNKLNSFGGDYIKAEMVKAFIASDEYRHRFGP